MPYNPICEKCGRVNTTEAYDFDGDIVKYRCECGHDGEMDIKSGNGKLTWRVEWAARWKIFGTTCEPFGKDHAAAGGSYDVSSVISEEIFDYPAPYPVPYEWITLDGEAMSKSHGVFFTPEQWLEIGPAESLNYYLFRSKPMKSKDFSPFTPEQWLEIGPAESLNYYLFRSKPMKSKDFSPKMPWLDFMDTFDKVERVFYDEEEAPSEKEGRKFKSIYKNAQINADAPLPFRPPFRFLVNAYQIVGEKDLEKIFGILKKNSQLTKSFKDKDFCDLSELELAQYDERVDNVIVWLDKYAPKFVKFQVQYDSIPKLPLPDDQIAFLKDLADLMEEKEFSSAEELHDAMYEVLESHGF